MKFLEYIKEMWSIVTNDLDDIYLYELLTRKASEKDNYVQWLNSLEKEQMLNYIFQEYRLSKMEKEDRTMIRFFKSRHSIGFMLRYPESMLPLHFQHLFDNLKSKAENTGYFITTSDRKIFKRKALEETIERYHLQSINFSDSTEEPATAKTIEDFDMIWIELFKVEEQSMYMKLTCRNAKEKADKLPAFEKLMETICEKQPLTKEAEANHHHNSGNGNF